MTENQEVGSRVDLYNFNASNIEPNVVPCVGTFITKLTDRSITKGSESSVKQTTTTKTNRINSRGH